MGGLSSGPGPGICFLALCLLFLAQQSQSAPVQEDNLSQQSRAQGYYDGSSSELSSGCYYNFQHYGEGDRIITNEPCLNCTCRNRMLMCYLRVCPFTKAIGQNCTIEKKPGQCCPLIICPEVPVQLLTSSTTTEHSESMSHKTQLGYGHHGTGVGHLDDYGCRINGEFYTNGAQIPGNIDKPCEVCYCIRNRTACIMQECTLQVDGCIPVYEEGLCCPVRYQCDYDYSYNAITTEEPRPTPGLVLTTTSGPFECQHDGKWYADGSSVDTEDPCEHCYCMKGDIVCAVQECKPPFEKDGHNCTAMPPAPGKCCPDSYHCDGNEIVAASETTFRQDRMHKFGRNNANVTMSITSSTSSSDKHHGWNYGTNANEKDTPNRFTDEQNKDGTTDEDGHMMITEGIPPTLGPIESGSHHLEGHFEGKPVSEGHGVNTDNMLTISQVIQSIVHNQTQLLNQNRLNQSTAGSGKPVKHPGGVIHDDKIHFPVGHDDDGKRPPFHHMQTDEDGNPLESHSTATELPEDYYGFTGGSSDIYAEHSGRPQTRPTKPSAGTGKPQPGQAIFGEHGHFGRPIKRPGTAAGSETSGEHEGTTDIPEGYTGQPGKRPIIHRVPGTDGTSVMTDEMGNPIEGVTGLPEGFTGKPGTVIIYYDEHGRPHKRPVGSKRPGMTGSDEGVTEVYEGVTGLPEGFTGRPGSIGTYVYYDEHGRPHTRPAGHKQPGGTATDDESSTGMSEGFTGKPGDQSGIFGEHGHSGRPIKKPVVQKHPGMTDEIGATGVYDESTGYPEGVTGKPGVHGQEEMDEDVTGRPGGFTGRPGGIHRPHRPGVHTQTGMEDGVTEIYEGTTEMSEGYTSQHGLGTIYGEHGHGGRPQKRPGMTEGVTNKDETVMEGVTKTPGHYDTSDIFGEHGHIGRPHKKPAHGTPGPEGVKVTTDEDGNVVEMTETAESHTRRPDGDGMHIYYDEHGRPKPGVHKKPGQVMTDDNGHPIEAVTGYPEYHTGRPDSDGMEIVYDKYGRPHRRPVHKKPGMDGEVTTGEYGQTPDEHEGTTETPDFVIMYDNHGRPIKLPVHKTPGMHVDYMPTDKDGKPVGGVTESTEAHTGMPGSDDYVIFYDQFGRPHKMPVGHKRPGVQVLPDANGKPLEGQDGITETPESFTGTPDDVEYTIVYDSHGRPLKRPIHKKPGMDDEHIPTDKYGKPVYGMTETPEGQTGTPSSDDKDTVYDEHGRPVKPIIVHKKPGMQDEDDMTDEHTGTTETAEGHTVTPEFMIVYDKHGRPVKKPIRRPGLHTDQYGKPVDGTTETPEGHTGTPDSDDEVFYDKYGNPIQVTGGHKKPGEGAMTDEDGKPLEENEGTTETAEDHTGTPEFTIVYDKDGRPLKKPIRKKPGMQSEHRPTDQYGKPVEGMTETPEGHTSTPDSDGEAVYDQHGRPIKRPVYTKPGIHDDQTPTDKYGKPVEGVTETPEGHTGRPQKKPIHGTPGPDGVEVTTDEDGNVVGGMTETPETHSGRPDGIGVYYDEHGRPKPGVHKRPSTEHGKPLEDHETMTETAEGHTDRPESVSFVTFFDQYGRPHRRPVHKKPGGVLTDEEGNPLEGVTGTAPGSTDHPETTGLYGEHGHTGRPHKRPGMTGEGGQTEEYEASTGTPDEFMGKPGTNGEPEIYGEHGHTGRPHKRPVSNKKPETQTSRPMDEDTEEHLTDRPGVHYDEHGRPYKKPVMPEHEEESTELPEGHTGRPESDGGVPSIFGEHGHTGRPHKRPVFHKKPGMIGEVMTDEDGNPIDGVTHRPEDDLGSTDRPGEGQTLYGKPGRPQKRPTTQKRPGMKPGMTDDEDSTKVPHETETGLATHDSAHPLFGEDGQPQKKPVTQKLPQGTHDISEDETSTDGVYGTTETSDGYTGHPLFGEHGHAGRPHHKPVGQKHPPTHGISSTETPEDISGTQIPEIYYDEHGRPIKPTYIHTKPGMPNEDEMTDKHTGTTETAESHTVTPEFMIVYDKHGRPVKKPIRRPGLHTDQYGKPIDGTTETPEGHTGTPDSDDEVFYDKYGNPIQVTGVHKKPGEGAMTDEDGKPLEEHEGTTETSEGHTGTPEFTIVYDKHGRPVKKPIRKKPGMQSEHQPTGQYGKPVDGMTETPEGHTGTPDSDGETVYDQYGRPIKRPVYTKPGIHDDQTHTDKYGKPVEGITETPEGHTSTPGTDDDEVYYDKYGKPIKPTGVHKKPGMDDEHGSTDEYGKPVYGATETPEGHTGAPEGDDEETVYDKHGRPVKRPVQKKPGMDTEHKPIDEYGQPVEGTTETPETHTGVPDYVIMYDNHGRPIKMPVHKTPGMHAEYMPTDKDGKPSEGVTGPTDDHTATPDSDDYVIFYDQFGRPHKMPVGHKKPVLTDDTGKPLGAVDHIGKPDSDDMATVYDEHGRPIKPTTVHKKPGMPNEDEMTDEHTATTETAEGHTVTPEFMIVYDKHGRPVKKPIRRPGLHTDQYGKPVDGTTETPEGHTGTPESDDEVFYDKYGNPIQGTGVQKKPGEGAMTDEDGKPLEEHEGTTETAEGHTGTPEFTIVYDKHGRPVKKPIRKKPGMQSEHQPTDQYGKPVEGMTETPEGHTGTPDSDGETVYDQHGRPIKRPVYTKPGMHDDQTPTDKYGKPVEGVTETPEGHTGTPESDAGEPIYDQYGRPVKRPVYTKPGMDDVTTNKYGKPDYESPEGQTGKPALGETPEIFGEHGHTGRPHKKPIHGTPGPDGVEITTDEDGNVIGGMTETPETHSGRPDGVGGYHDEHERPKPAVHKKPSIDDSESTTVPIGKPLDEHEETTETGESHTETPEFMIVYDQYGRPIKKPIRKKPGVQGEHEPTDKYGKPVEVMTETPEGNTGTPDSDEVSYDKYGKPIKPTGDHMKPGMDDEHVPTDKYGKPVYGMTETPEGQTGTPSSDDKDTVYDEHGRPVKPIIVHKKPGMQDEDEMTDEHTGTTETAEGHTVTPVFMIVYDKHGRPVKKPIRRPGLHTDQYGKPVDGATETPEGHTGTPDSDDEVFYDKYGNPIQVTGVQKKPGEGAMTDEDGKPLEEHEGTTETAEGHTGTSEFTIVYDKHGRPVKQPIRKKPGMQSEHQPTDQYGKPVDGMTETPGHTGTPDSDGETVYDQHGRPIKRPVYTKPGIHDDQTPTDEYGKPVEGVTETPEGHTGTPESDAGEPLYDQYGRPVKRPIHSKPDMDDATTDKYGKPVDESPESQTGKPALGETPEIFGEHGFSGRPHKKPIHVTPGPDGVEVTTNEGGNVIGGMTETPESHSGRPDVYYDENGRPKPGVHKQPEVVTDDGKPGYSMTETPEGHVSKPVTDHGEHTQPGEKPTDEHGHPMEEEGVTRKPGVVYDEQGRPHGKPEEEHATTDELGHPVYEVVTMVTEDHTGKPESDSHHVMPEDHDHSKPHDDEMGSTSQPQETQVAQKKPGVTVDDTMTPEEGMETSEHQTGRPESDSEPTIFGEHGHTGRPHTRPVKPGTVGSQDATETPEGDHTTGSSITFDEEGRPSVQKRPETTHEEQPQGSTPHADDQEPHKVEQHPTGVHGSTPVTSQEGPGPHSKPEDADEGTETPVHKKPEMEGDHATESPEYDSTEKPSPSGVEIYFDEFGRPHHQPIQTHPSSTEESDVHNEVPEGFTGKPDPEDLPGLFGEPGHTGRPHKRPVTKPEDVETHTTVSFTERPDGVVVYYDEQGRPLKKPVTSDDFAATEGPDGFVVTEPQLFGEHGRPHKRPVLKPGSGIADESDHTQKQPGVEDHGEESTHKPDHDSPITLFGESGRPTKKPIKPVGHDEERPEENEISEGDKATELPGGEHVTGKPEGTKVAEATHGSRPEGESPTDKPEGIWQYLPPKETATHEEPEGATHVKPAGETTEGLTAPEEDNDDEDDSLIITTDEPEEETGGVHGQPTAHEGEEPTDIKTKIPEESGKPHGEVHPITPGLVSHSPDFTTPGYGTHDSSLPVTDEAIHGHPVTHGVDGQPDLTHLGSDGVSFPGANVVFDKDGKPHIIPGQHSEYVPGHAAAPVTTPGLEDEVPAEGGDTGHDTERPESATGEPVSAPEDGSTPGVTIVFGEDGKPHIVPDSETSSVVKDKPDGTQPEEGKPASTPEATATTEKKPSHGHFPGIPAGFLPSLSGTGAPNTDAPIMIDGGLNEGSPFDAVLDSLANVLRPMHTTEKAAETTETHEEVPGEGSCFMDGVTYPNNSEVPPLSPCHTQCTCVSSIIHCLSLKCPSPPEDVSHCTTVHDEKSCCPTYICDETSTSPVEGHEATTVPEDEHGSVETETPLTSEGEEGQHTPVKTVTQQSEVDADKPSAGKPDDEEQLSTTDRVTGEPQGETHHEKPELDTAATEEPKPDSMTPGPAGIEVPGEDGQAPTKVTEGQIPENPEESTHVKPGRPQRPQSGYFPPSSDVHHPSTALPSYFGTGKPITTVEEHTVHQRPDSDHQVLGTDEPMTEDKKPSHQEQQMTTDDHKPQEGMGEPDSPTKVTGEDTAMPEGHSPTKMPSEELDHHHKPTTSGGHPSAGEHLPETDKPHETVTSDDHTTTDEESSMRPHEKPDESSPTQKTPQDESTGQETGDHTSYRPEDGVETSEEHKKPSVHPTSMDDESALTTSSPHERPTGGEEPQTGVEHQRPGVIGEEDPHGEPSDEKPGHDSITTDMPESGQVTSKVPVTHDTVGTLPDDEEDHKQTVTTDRPEAHHTHTSVNQFGKPMVSSGQPEESQPEYDSTDKVEPSTEHPTDHATSEVEEHHKKPEGVAGEDVDHSTISPEDKFATGKPIAPSGVFTDSHTKPEADVPEEHGTTERPHVHTVGEEHNEGSEAPHTKPADSDEDSTHTTARPHGQPSEETEGKPETPRPSSMDSESEPTSGEPQGKPTGDEEDTHKPQIGKHPTSEDTVHTTGRPEEEMFEGQEPHVKPEVDSHISTDEETGHITTTRPQGEPTGDVEKPHKRPHPSIVDEEFGHTTTRPHGHPSDVEEPHKRPEEPKPEDDLMEPSTKRPMESGTSDESGQEGAQIDEHHPGAYQPTTEGVMVDGQPEHDFASTLRPKPVQSTPGHVSHKPKPEEIPEEVLLHPTRTPGTFQTQRPDMEPEHETTDHQPSPMVDETVSTIFPEGFFRPVTKRPTAGADKPEDSMTHRPETEGPEGTGKPTHASTTEIPENLAEIFGTARPTPSHIQHGQKPDFGDFLPGTGIFQKPDFPKPDEDLGEQEIPEESTPHEEYPSQYTTGIPGLKPGPWKRPIYSTNGTHFVQYVPVKEGEAPSVPQGAMLGEPEEGPDGDKYWPIIFVKPAVSTTELTTETQKPTPQQVFNGTHFIQYVPFEDGEKPKVPEGATLGQPVKKPDGQVYWPVVDTKPLPTGPEDEPVTQEPFPGQIYNGTHFIQYLPYDEDKPEVPEGATLGQPQTGPNGEKYWPIISTKPIPDEEGTTTGSVESQPEQIFNGTHFIQYVPFKDGEAPDIPEEATLGQPQKGPDGQIYWPIINTKPIPVTPSEDAPTTHAPPVQVFNGTNFIQYVPFKDGEAPEVPEGATLGQPQKTPDGEIYWPIIYAKPQPVKPEGSLPSQVFNGTHYIQYVPYEEDKKPEVPEGATLGQPQKTPEGQTFWPLIYSKPVPTKPEDEPVTTEEPFKTQLFNGTHFIQYIPFTEGFEPQLPEEATMGEPVTQPDGQKYWPIIYEKLPTTSKPEEIQPHLGQVYNGTHFIKYVPYRPNHEPQVPEEATVGEPVKGPDGQMYWPIISTKPLPHLQEEPIKPQVFNGTHYIQYVPYEEEKPEVPEGAILGEPQTQPDGQKYWPIISKTPLPGLPITNEQEPEEPTTTEPVNKQVFNGTHYIQYVPYKPGKRPVIPEGVTLGKPTKGPNDQMYWPIIHQKPVPGLPVATQSGPFEDAVPTTEPVTQQVFNGTHYIQYVPYKPGQRPVIPEGATLGKPTKGQNDQMYWPIIYQTPVPGLPITTQGPFDDDQPTTVPVNVQFHNGTHYIQYVPYKPGKRPVVPEEATLGKPTRRPDNQLYWPIIRLKPVEGLPIATQQGPVEDDLPTTEPVTEQFFNGTHYIQYVPYKPGQRPIIPEDATLGNPTRGPNNQLYWPIVYLTPVPDLPITIQSGQYEDAVTTTEPVTEQFFNGTHYIQYVPYKPGQRPIIPEDATLGNPTRGPNNQLYWPIVTLTPVPDLPITTQSGPFEDAVTTTESVTLQAHNGTHLIQYIPYKPGQQPEVPEGAILGKPTKGPGDEMYWPVIYRAPVPDFSDTNFPFEGPVATTDPANQQAFNGTHYIQYLPYNPGQRPMIPEGATLGKPTKAPNDQMFWPIIYQTPIPGLGMTTEAGPYDTATTKKPFTGQVFNGTHYIQYLPYEPGQRPMIPEDAILGKPTKGPNDQMYYPIIHSTPFPGIPIATETEIFEETTTEPVTIQVFNGTHYIHYVPYRPGQRPMISQDASLGKPTKGPNDEMYWPVIYSTPASFVPVTTEEPFEEATTLAYPTDGQIFNGTHYIQYVPYKPGKQPSIPEDATLGQPTKGPSDQMFWPVIHMKPVPGVPIVDRTPSFDPSKGQVFNGTHYIQYVPYRPMHRPVIPTEAKLGKPTLGPNGQMFWPIIHPKPVPGLPIVMEKPFEESTPEKGQYFNGTHYIQYVPYTPGHRPVVPEGATLGHPETKSDGQKYWPIIRSRPAPGIPINWTPYETATPQPEQIFNGTHYIQYLPYNPTQMPEVPEGATLGQPQKGPGGQMYWVLISDKPIPVHTFNGTHVVQYVTPITPEQDSTDEHKPSKPLQVFNGTHYIQYVPYTPGQQPVVPEGAVLGKPTKGPEGQTYWPIIYKKRPVGEVPSSTAIPQEGQLFNGTHFIRYVPYNPSKRPNVPEGATISKPQTRPDGHKYWVISSKKPLPAMEDEPVSIPPGQIYNGTHYIQYVPYNPSQMPKVPEGAVLGHPQMGPEGHMNWVIISDKPLPAQPGTQYVQYVTPVTPEENKFSQGLTHNGTHYIQYVPYKPAQIPHIPNDATLGDLEQGPGGQMYWPIIFKKPPQGPIFNGTHYVTYAPHNATHIDNSTKDHPFWDYGQYGGTKVKPSTTESYPTWSKPGQNATKHPTQESGKPSYGERPGGEDSFESIDEDHLIEYPSGSDYDETQEQPYGPGTCRYAGKVYVSAQQIPRDDPCDFCFCFRSDIICLQQSCPPPIPGCHEEPIQGFCCPRYECHVRMATLLNVTSTTTTTTTTLPPHFLSHVYNGAAGRTGCFVQGKAYRVGQAIASASGPCMDCICGGDGKMKCEPKVCTPEPMVRQMMVSTEKAMTANQR